MRTISTIGLMLLFSTSVCADYYSAEMAFNKGKYEVALEELMPLVEKGHPNALNLLGHMYADGKGVEQNSMISLKWYKLAAEKGQKYSQKRLGYIYAKGIGVTQDYILAHMWYNISASQGVEDAKWGRDYVAHRMTTADISKAQELARQCVAKTYIDC